MKKKNPPIPRPPYPIFNFKRFKMSMKKKKQTRVKWEDHDNNSERIFQWMDLFCKKPEIPLCWMEETDWYCQIPSIDQETLKKYMRLNSVDIEQRFHAGFFVHGKNRPFGLVFDVWDDGSGEMLIACFIAYEHPESPKMPMLFLLCLTPTIDPAFSDGDAQIESIGAALRSVSLSWELCLFITAENTAVTASIAKKMNTHFIGCYSHKIALAVSKLLMSDEGVRLLLDKVNDIMSKLNNLHFRRLLTKEG